MEMKTRFLLFFLLLTSAFTAGCSFLPKRIDDVHYAIWVTRWDYRTESDVRDIIKNCAQGGFDTVLFQVRGNGTVFYRSDIEPWSEEFGFQDPGFDPLEVACDEAGKQGLALHAWVNAIPGWRGIHPPTTKDGKPFLRQLFYRRPGWFLKDQFGNRQPLEKDYYVALNPCLPEVQNYIASICEEIVSRYPVAGIHLDYIRFLEKKKDAKGRSLDYPRDRVSVGLFERETGLSLKANPKAWESWKTSKVTELVALCRRVVRRANRRASLSAAVIRTPERARNQVHQDWPTWVKRGYVDGVFPMQYDRNDQRFAQRVKACAEAVPPKRLIMGIGVYLHRDPAQTLRQMDIAIKAGCQGICFFAYTSFFKGAQGDPAPGKGKNPKDPASPSEALLRSQRRMKILPRLQSFPSRERK
jgi:uncharacterized lipoprotein YddW (UPF0748 family)